MAFTWSETISGTKLTSTQFTEIKNNINSLDASISDATPAVTGITWTQSNGAGIEIIDDVYDEIQNNLNILRSNNYCRGYQANICTTVYTARHYLQYASHNYAQESRSVTECFSAHTTYCSSVNSSQNTTYHSNVYGTKHSSVFGTQHYSN